MQEVNRTAEIAGVSVDHLREAVRRHMRSDDMVAWDVVTRVSADCWKAHDNPAQTPFDLDFAVEITISRSSAGNAVLRMVAVAGHGPVEDLSQVTDPDRIVLLEEGLFIPALNDFFERIVETAMELAGLGADPFEFH